MFEFWKKAEETVDTQVEELKKLSTELIEPDDKGGYKARPGIMVEQIQKASETAKRVQNAYDDIGVDLSGYRKEVATIDKKTADVRERALKTGTAKYYAQSPVLKALLGL